MTIKINYRRKRKGKTNYKKRLALLKSKLPRLIVRKTNKHIIVQIAQYEADGDKIIATANSSELKKHGWNYSQQNLPAAYLTGALIGKKVKGKIKKCILDLGLQTPVKGSKLYAALKGSIDSGLEIPASEDSFPNEERITGKHILQFNEKGLPKNTLTKYKDIASIDKNFTKVKETLLK